jgi:PadR family transcriptional regulator PadR
MEQKFISRTEEFILLSIWRLGANAYGVTIRDQLKEVTGKTWAYGALFVMLSRLEKKGYLTSSFTDPLPQRGGKSRRIFQLSEMGIQSLEEVRKVQESVWSGVKELSVRYLRDTK